MKFEETHEAKSLGHLGTDADNRSNLVSLADVGRWLMHGPDGYPYLPALAKLLDDLEATPTARLFRCFPGTWAQLIDDGVLVDDGWFLFDMPADTLTHGRLAVLHVLRVGWLQRIIGPNLIDPREEFPVLPGFAWAMTRADAAALFDYGFEVSSHASSLNSQLRPAPLALVQGQAGEIPVSLSSRPQRGGTIEKPRNGWHIELDQDRWKDDRGHWTDACLDEWRRLRAEGASDVAIARMFGGFSRSIVADKIGHKEGRLKKSDGLWCAGIQTHRA